VDYDVVAVRSNVRVNGIFLKEGEQVGVVNPESGAQQLDLLEDERQFDSTKIEREITSPDSNKKILEAVKKWTEDHEKQYGRFPKTLIFAANDLPHTSHADQLVEIGRDVPRYQKLFSETKPALDKLGIAVLIVDTQGQMLEWGLD